MKKHDVLIVGGGPTGSTLLSYLAKAGVDAALFEREVFPRFHIGESLLPFSMDIFRETGVFDTLNSGKYIQKYGAQFIHFEGGDEVYFDFEGGLDRNHPMAFEVPRDQFDKDLLDHARKLGGTVYQPESVKEIEFFDEHVRVLTNKDEYQAKFLADASGRTAMLGKKMKLRHPHTDLINNVGLFAHYVGVERLAGKREGDITVGLLDGKRWCWIIPFVGDRVSIGVVCYSGDLRQDNGFSEYIDRAVGDCPVLRDRLRSAERVTEVGMISNYSHGAETIVGKRWILAGDAGMFLDPVFSSGVHLGVTSAKHASKALSEALDRKIYLTDDGLNTRYENTMRLGLKRFHCLIRLFYDTNFVRQMKKTFTLKNTREAFTSALAGDVWNDDNFLFRTGALEVPHA